MENPWHHLFLTILDYRINLSAMAQATLAARPLVSLVTTSSSTDRKRGHDLRSKFA